MNRHQLFIAGLLYLLGTASTPAWAISVDDEVEIAIKKAQQAQQEQAWAEAELYYERVLMFNPDHAEARIQLALLFAQRGAIDSAVAFLRSLIEDPRTPAAYRQRLEELISQLPELQGYKVAQVADGLEPAKLPIIQARFGLGYSTNPFLQADINALTISLPKGNLELEVQTDIRPAAVLSSNLYYQAPNECGFELLDQRKESLERNASQKLLLFCNMNIEQETLQNFLSYSNSAGQNQRTELGINWMHSTWRAMGQVYQEVELDRQGYTLRVDHLLSRPDWQVLLFIEGEHNNQKTVPGYVKTGLYAEKSITNDISLLYQWVVQHDLDGYSPLLKSGVRRVMTTAEIGLQKKWGRYAGWDANTAVFTSQRWSNISLFEYKNSSLQFNIKRNF